MVGRPTRNSRRWYAVVCILLVVCDSFLLFARPAHALSTAQGDGIVSYGQASNATSQWRTYGGVANTFGAATGTIAGATGVNTVVKTSPVHQEALSGYVTSAGVLHLLCYNGTTWTDDWTATVGGTGTTRRFDITYETASGDAMVAYSSNAATTNELQYRTKLGGSGCGATNWSGAINLDPVRTTGIVQWVRLESSPVAGSNTIGLAWSDANSDLSAMEWTGASWAVAEPAAVLEASLEFAAAANDVLSFDIAFESLTGNFMVVWSPSSTTVACTVGSCIKWSRYTTSWSAAAGIGLISNEGTSIDISANPNSNEIVMAALGNRVSTLGEGYWSGSAWTGKASQDTTAATPVAGTKLVATGWLISGATTRSITTYNDAATTTVGYVTGSTSTFTTQAIFTPTPALGNPQKWYDIQTDPFQKDRLMFTVSDLNSDLFAKRLVMTATPAFTWTNADGSAALEANLAAALTPPFSFAYWRYIAAAGSLTPDIVDGSGVTVGSPSLSMSGITASNICQAATGTLGISTQKVRLTNSTITPGWALSIAATGGTTASWSSGTATYDFNDATGSGCTDGADADSLAGQLSGNPSVATLTPQSGCTSNGVSLGSSSAFVQGSIDNITLATAANTAAANCYWEITGVALSQQIPGFQDPGSYTLPMTITAVAQ